MADSFVFHFVAEQIEATTEWEIRGQAFCKRFCPDMAANSCELKRFYKDVGNEENTQHICFVWSRECRHRSAPKYTAGLGWVFQAGNLTCWDGKACSEGMFCPTLPLSTPHTPSFVTTPQKARPVQQKQFDDSRSRGMKMQRNLLETTFEKLL